MRLLTAVSVAALLGLSAGAAQAQSYKIFVSNERDHTISVLDGDSLEVIDTFETGRRPRGITKTPDNKWVLLCASDDDHIEVYDAETHELVKTLPSGPDPELFVLHTDGETLYIANEDDNLVTVINIVSGEILAEVPVGVEPEGMGVSPDGRYVVNTSETTNMAHFIDTGSLRWWPTYESIPGRALPSTRAMAANSGCRRRSVERCRSSIRRPMRSPRRSPSRSQVCLRKRCSRWA